MQFDRKITLTVGNNRRSINWQPQTLMLSEFYDKLRIPARSTETLQEYLNLKKSEQDDRKDIATCHEYMMIYGKSEFEQYDYFCFFKL